MYNVRDCKFTLSIGVIMTGGTNSETGFLNTVESYPPTCSIPNLPTGTFNVSTYKSVQWGTGIQHLFLTLRLQRLWPAVDTEREVVFSLVILPLTIVSPGDLARLPGSSALTWGNRNTPMGHPNIVPLFLGYQDHTIAHGCPRAKTPKLYYLEETAVRPLAQQTLSEVSTKFHRFYFLVQN